MAIASNKLDALRMAHKRNVQTRVLAILALNWGYTHTHSRNTLHKCMNNDMFVCVCAFDAFVYDLFI